MDTKQRSSVSTIGFADPELAATLNALSTEGLDALGFGVIGFDASNRVVAYNSYESDAAGLRKASVMGRPLFDEVAPCMNNFLVAQRFEEAFAVGKSLDATIDYVLTLKMRPTNVELRLLATPLGDRRYVLVSRRARSG